MKTSLRIFLLFLALSAALFSCKKDDDPAPDNGGNTPDPTPQELISQVWKVDEVQINGVKDQATDYSGYRFEFKSSGKYKFQLPDSVEGTWELSSNNQKLLLDKGTEDELEVAVLSLKENRLNLEFTLNSPKTGTRKILFKLKK